MTICAMVLTTALIVVPAECGELRSVSLLARSATRSVTQASTNLALGLRYNKEDPAARSILALDKNKDGRISPDEITMFANAQGLDAESAKQEFSGIDANNDGVLDAKEIVAVLGVDAEVSSPPQQAAPQEPAQLPAAKAAKAAEADAWASAPATMPSAGSIDLDLDSEVNAVPAAAALQDTSSLHDFNENAQAAAADVVKELAYEEKQEAEARLLDRKAAEFKANSTSLERSTMQGAMEAGTEAARQKAQTLLAKILKLEDEAERAEVRAAALHAKSKAEVQEANELMSVTDAALKRAA